MPKVNSFVVPIISPHSIGEFIDTLYKHTPPNFYVFVIDQTTDDEAYNKVYVPNRDKVHMWIKSYRNLGYSKALNTGLRLTQTPYVTFSNDDVSFLNIKWWQGIEDTFKMDSRIIAVNPMSPKEGAFGYGLTNENTKTWMPPEGFIRDGEFVVPQLPGGSMMTYNGSMSDEQYDWLVNEHPRWTKDTLCDGICMWCTVFKRDELNKIGPMDERFYPGNGEDIEMCARAYSCAWPIEHDVCMEPDNSQHKRMVATTKSWVWHRWFTSKEYQAKHPNMSRDSWNNLGDIWPDGIDVWGHGTRKDGTRFPYKRVPEVYIENL